MRLVLLLHPRPADAQDRPAVTDVVERRDGLGHEPGVAEGVGADQQPEARPLGGHGAMAASVDQPSKIGWYGSPKIA